MYQKNELRETGLWS